MRWIVNHNARMLWAHDTRECISAYAFVVNAEENSPQPVDNRANIVLDAQPFSTYI